MLQQIVGSWNKNLGCCNVLCTDRWNRLLRLFSQIVAGIGLVDRFGFHAIIFFLFFFFFWIVGEHSLKGLGLKIDLGWFVVLCSLIGLSQD